MVNPDNVCDNVCMWDGDVNTWQPPEGYTMLVQATTLAKNWVLNETATPPVYELQVAGVGGIGFTWDGTYLTTNESQPIYVPPVVTPSV